jgi:hypothetical protein
MVIKLHLNLKKKQDKKDLKKVKMVFGEKQLLFQKETKKKQK